MNYKLTRGWRNNNPLNIIHSKSEWQGKSPVQTDKRSVQFVSEDMPTFVMRNSFFRELLCY